MNRKGLGEKSEFYSFHPLVNTLYFVLVLAVTMFSLSPYYIAVTFIGAWAYTILLKGFEGLKTTLIFGGSVLLIMVVINTLFNNNGATTLFYLNTNRVTVESMVYGLCGGLVLIAVIVWFGCFNVIMTSDKLIYIFGKVAPVLGLTLSMIFRFIPLLKTRFAEISLGQRCMGRSKNKGSIIERSRQLLKEISILIAWSLEASIESADSMEARGYGLKGRTSFHLFKMSRRDYIAIGIMILAGAPVIFAVATGATNMVFYPKIVPIDFGILDAVYIACYIVVVGMPIFIDIWGDYKWKQLELQI